MIIIAHRLSTLEHCDRIYMMKNGGIVAEGSYQEVVLNQK
jgi:ABC-type multidrug transport system fused ATPase/permease subunit